MTARELMSYINYDTYVEITRTHCCFEDEVLFKKQKVCDLLRLHYKELEQLKSPVLKHEPDRLVIYVI